MDDLKFDFNGKFMKRLIAGVIRTMLSKKLGYDINIEFNNIRITAVNGKVRIHLNVDVETTTEEFEKIVKSMI